MAAALRSLCPSSTSARRSGATASLRRRGAVAVVRNATSSSSPPLPSPGALTATLHTWTRNAQTIRPVKRYSTSDTDMVPGGKTDITKPPPAEYYSVQTEEFEYMIQLDNKGRMNLNNTFIVDARSGIRSRPAVEGALPEGFRNYVEVPFLDPDTGDSIYMRRPSCKMLKCYYVEALTNDAEPEVDKDKVYFFNFDTRTLSVVKVERGPDWDAEDAYLRFLDDGRVVLQSSESTPPPGLTAEEHYFAEMEADAAARVPSVDKQLMDQLNQDKERIEYELDIPDVDL
mmetsp:Transcript_18290/g.32542  ORF Transcript_18290/g.32542 Transcript_18290/m.32542 type:complete len:286 (-) Transcript_18290:83-940(-)|eukprot:CAMPEP_0177796218 /NCGR_PEP_ID=MMETSP0491_2-20121128/26665_1 /TAXON_ID=63592 /ORGANISM="Tetraselmis chuii, Strain PLY429" /LENGTH=285 /DNA_ID=CAMNT_0019319133 /DNA_START=76 /DNA_END=933 /DNA_ORIENTATION=-